MHDNETPAGTIGLYVLGVICLGIGLYFLFHRGVTPDPAFGADLPRVVSFQRLGIGMAFSVMSSVFLTGAMRPLPSTGAPRAAAAPRSHAPEPGPRAAEL